MSSEGRALGRQCLEQFGIRYDLVAFVSRTHLPEHCAQPTTLCPDQVYCALT
ncbi:hypothetical protein P3T24_006558 [Paraburkholderia sp. GAS33]